MQELELLLILICSISSNVTGLAEVIGNENVSVVSAVLELNPFCSEAPKGIGAEAFVMMQQHLQICRESSNGPG